MSHAVLDDDAPVLDLPGLFGPRAFAHDVRRGTTRDQGGRRHAWMVEDVLAGFVVALRQQQPITWSATLHDCGVRWGHRAWQSLGHELELRHGMGPGALDLSDWLAWVEEWFARSGWGRLRLDLSAAAPRGIVIARLEGSVLVEALPGVNARVDSLVAGVLEAIFGQVTGRRLAAAELACVREGASACLFVISSADRVGAMVEAVDAGADPEQILEENS